MDEVFEAHRQRQYPRELLFSIVVELMTLVALGLRPSLHAAARQLGERLPASLAALYQNVNHCEPVALRPLMAGLPGPASGMSSTGRPWNLPPGAAVLRKQRRRRSVGAPARRSRPATA